MPDYPDADKGKCRSCGFLSKHACRVTGLPSPRFYEMEHAEREEPPAMRSHSPFPIGLPHVTEPMCFLNKINLAAVMVQQGDDALVAAILADQKCGGWYPYMPGLSTQEHYDKLTMQQLELDRQKFEERLAKRDEEVHTALVKAEQNFQLERDRIQQPTQKLMKRLTVLAVLLGILQVAVGLSPDSLMVKGILKIWHYI